MWTLWIQVSVLRVQACCAMAEKRSVCLSPLSETHSIQGTCARAQLRPRSCASLSMVPRNLWYVCTGVSAKSGSLKCLHHRVNIFVRVVTPEETAASIVPTSGCIQKPTDDNLFQTFHRSKFCGHPGKKIVAVSYAH